MAREIFLSAESVLTEGTSLASHAAEIGALVHCLELSEESVEGYILSAPSSCLPLMTSYCHEMNVKIATWCFFILFKNVNKQNLLFLFGVRSNAFSQIPLGLLLRQVLLNFVFHLLHVTLRNPGKRSKF